VEHRAVFYCYCVLAVLPLLDFATATKADELVSHEIHMPKCRPAPNQIAQNTIISVKRLFSLLTTFSNLMQFMPAPDTARVDG